MILSEIQVKCVFCSENSTLKVDTVDLQRWKNGVCIQDAMPYLTCGNRELLISGTCGKCFDEMFSDFDE